MENFDGLTNQQIRRGLLKYNGLSKFGKDEDLYYSSNGYLVVGPNAVTITRNLRTGKTPRLEINWKFFHSSNLKNGITLRKKIFVLVDYLIKFEDGSELEHVALLFVDPTEQNAKYLDSFATNFDKISLDVLEKEAPWESLYGQRIIHSYFYKYDGGIPNACALDCLYSIDRILRLDSFEKAARETLFLRRVRRLQNQKINIKFTYQKAEYIWYLNGIRNCYDILLNHKVFQQQ